MRRIRSILAHVVRLGLFPVGLYTVLFVGLTYPLIYQFSTHFFADQGDGLQNVWNIWWVHKAVTELGQSPWSTGYLHYPYGVSLYGHTLNAFNGYLAIPLMRWLTLVQAHNSIVLFSFAVGGLTACWLAYDVTRAYRPSIIGGAVFTFANFHFAHAEGHLQLVSLEWIPLFILLWRWLLREPRWLTALAAAGALYLTLLCDYYYFMYAVMAALLIVAWRIFQTRSLVFWLKRDYLPALGLFSVAALLTSGLHIEALFTLNRADPLVGAHADLEFSTDLLAPIIPGGHWRFAWLTEPYWSRLPGNIHESSVHLGVAVVLLILLVPFWRKRVATPDLGLWYSMLLVFFGLSLGPTLQIWGQQTAWTAMPYSWLVKVAPPLQLSGVPVRMMVMVTLCASVIAAVGFKYLIQRGRLSQSFCVLLLVLLTLEYLPKPLPTSAPLMPGYVLTLREGKADGGVIDTVSSKYHALYFQTIYDKPMAFGYLARVPSSVVFKNRQLAESLALGDCPTLQYVYNIRYVVQIGAVCQIDPERGKQVWTDGRASVWRLE